MSLSSIRAKSEHPIATGILQKAKGLSLSIPATKSFNVMVVAINTSMKR